MFLVRMEYTNIMIIYFLHFGVLIKPSSKVQLQLDMEYTMELINDNEQPTVLELSITDIEIVLCLS